MTTPDAASREALQFWGYLFKENRGTELLNRLLDGIANYVTAHFPPTPDCVDITPAQLAAFYKAVGGDYDILFLKTHSPDLAFIYKNLGCLHSLQPAPESNGFDSPTIPALKRKGFVTWQTIQLLLGPDEHVPFVQNAVERFDIVDPGTGDVFPKLLPKEAFPEKPDEKMERWYQEVSERLRKEMEEGQEEQHQHQHQHAADQGRSNSPGPGPGLRPPPAERKRHPRDRISSDFSEESMDDHVGAAEYFRDPLYRRGDARPRIVRRYSRAPPNSRESISERGRQVASTIGRIWPPWGRGKERRGSLSDRHASGGYPEGAAGDYDYSGEEVEHLSPEFHRRHAHGGSTASSGHSTRAHAGSSHVQSGRRPGSSRSFNSDSESESGSPPRMKVPRPKNYSERGDVEHDGRPQEPRFSRRGGYANHHVPIRHRRSHSPPSSPREYFPPFNDHAYGRRHSQQQGYAGPAAADQARPSYAAHVAPSPPMPRERHSDPPSRMAESREKNHERRSPLETSDREHRKRERERERAQRERADSHRESTRPTPRDTFSQQQRDKLSVPPQPPTPPPNLSALNGFGPSKEPLFATQVAHLQPPGGPYVTRTYYDSSTSPSAATAATATAAPSAANTRSRRPSYPPRGSYTTATPERAAMPARASSMRYASRSRAPSGSASANASPRMAPMGLDNDRERWAFGSVTGGLSSRGSSRERARYVGPDGMQGVGGRRYPVDFNLGPGMSSGGAPVGGGGWKEERY